MVIRKKNVQATNDSSSKSKDSMERKGYYPMTHIGDFVINQANRSPLINRGYYVRTKAINSLVKSLSMNKDSKDGSDIQVVNLGCGFDTHFSCYRENGDISWWDIDFEELMVKKAQCLVNNDDNFSWLNINVRSKKEKDDYILYESSDGRYRGVGLDLSLVKDSDFRAMHLLRNKKTIFIAECSITYMDNKACDRLLATISKSFDNACFILYEQIVSAVGREEYNAFTHTMTSHFCKLQSSLRNLDFYPRLEDQAMRFKASGFPHVSACDLANIWYKFFDSEERARVHALEPFDEYEEFDIKLCHYFVLLASNCSDNNIGSLLPDQISQAPSYKSIQSAILDWKMPNAVLKVQTSARLPFKVWGHSCGHLVSGKTICFGGFGSVASGKETSNDSRFSRMNAIVEIDRNGNLTSSPIIADISLSPRIYQASIVPKSGNGLIVHGGRASPMAIFGDLWMIKGGDDKSVNSLISQFGPKRYRHAIVQLTNVVSETKNPCIFLFGGLGPEYDSQTPNEICHLFLNDKWHFLSFDRSDLNRHSHTMHFDGKFVWVFGGRPNNGKSDEPLSLGQRDWPFALKLSIDLEKMAVETKETLNFMLPQTDIELPPRYSHTSHFFGSSGVLLVGGVSCFPKFVMKKELNDDNFDDDASELDAGSPSLYKDLTFCWLNCENCTWVPLPNPLDHGKNMLVNHESCLASTERPQQNPGIVNVMLIGGGATCFSMGTHFDENFRVLELNVGWLLGGDYFNLKKGSIIQEAYKANSHESLPMPYHHCFKQQEQQELMTFDELATFVPSETLVSVHVSCDRVFTFVPQRNYEFQVMPWQDFISRLRDPEEKRYFYLRSIGGNPRKEPSDIFISYPKLCDALQLDSLLSMETVSDVADSKSIGMGMGMGIGRGMGKDRVFSSVLRVGSAGMSLWTHYDVMDNILVHYAGRKRVKLWSPDLYDQLYVQGSSSDANPSTVVDLQYNWSVNAAFQGIPATKEFILEPGSILHIPALWFHHVETLAESGPSLSINIFYRPEEQSSFPALWFQKRDLYGNRDPKPIEDFEKASETLMSQMNLNMSPEFKRFYAKKITQLWQKYSSTSQ